LIEQRHALDHADKLAGLADELLRLNLDVLVVYGAWHIGEKLRGTTPVVFTVVPDPVAQGMVTNLARPGINQRTAKAIGLNVPHALLARADHVID